MERLRCGVIYTEAFAAFLRGWWLGEPAKHAHMIPTLECVPFLDGPRAGEHWSSLYWMPKNGVEEHLIFKVGRVELHLPRQSQQALKFRCLDAKDGQWIVI